MQKRGGWVPENNTDFIFTVVAEELGFAGAAVLILLYLALLTRTVFIATATEAAASLARLGAYLYHTSFYICRAGMASTPIWRRSSSIAASSATRSTCSARRKSSTVP